MPRNYFADPLEALGQGADFMNTWTDRAAKQRAGYQAAPRIAQGDYRGAAQAYGAEGLADEARTMMGDQNAMDRQQAQDERQASQDEIAAAERRVQTLGKLAQGLMTVPAGGRRAALERAMPLFAQIGLDPGPFAALTEEQLTDDQLQMFGAELEQQWQAVNLGNGGLGRFNNRTGDTEIIREPDPPPVIVGNGAMAVDRETGQVIQRNPKTFAPPRAGGGRGGGGLSGMSTADLIAAVRGAR